MPCPKRGTLSVLAWLVALSGLHCGPRHDDDTVSSSIAAPVAGAVPDFELTAHTGERFGSAELRGKVWVATVMATQAQGEAPQQAAVLTAIRRELADDPNAKVVRLISLAADPEYETPAILQEYAQQIGARSESWLFLTGDRGAVSDVVDELGLSLDSGTHSLDSTSSSFVLVDRHHNIRGRYHVETIEDMFALLTDLRHILPEAPELDDGSGRAHLVVPPENLYLPWINSRRDAQLLKIDQSSVYYDFGFSDRLPESGITFRNEILDLAGKEWIPNHYDHGNGVAIADVDGDSRLDLYFTSSVGGNELWRNLGDGRFEDATDRAGVALDDRVNVAASFADIDNDGDPDLYVTSVRGGNTLFENDGSGVFSDITERAGVGYSGHSSAAAFFDYNLDGLLDLLLVNVGVYTSDSLRAIRSGTSPEESDEQLMYFDGLVDAFTSHLHPDRSESSILFKNVGDGRFVDATHEAGIGDERWSGDATPLDINRDGWPDLYVLNMQGNDAYYENVDGERFVEKTADVFGATPWGSMGVKAFDYDNDGSMEIYVTDMHSDMSQLVEPKYEKEKSDMVWPERVIETEGESIFGNAFYKHDGSRYRDVSDTVGAENYWPWGLSVGDLNADGYQDVFIASSMNYPFRYGVNSVLLNDRGRQFVDSEYALGVEPRRDGRVLTPWYELSCDAADQGHEYCEGRVGNVLVWGALGSRSSAIFDLDEDGDLDVVTNDFNSEPMVLISDLSDVNPDLRFLKVELVGTTSNRDGLGARVTVSAGGREFVQVLDGVTGYLSHGVYPLYFGLGDAASIEQVEVRWPSGETQIVTGPIAANALLTITEE